MTAKVIPSPIDSNKSDVIPEKQDKYRRKSFNFLNRMSIMDTDKEKLSIKRSITQKGHSHGHNLESTQKGHAHYKNRNEF